MASIGWISRGFVRLWRAAAKAAGARLRSMGAVRTHPRWAERASICERCPMRVIHRGVSYCGPPFLHKPDRDPVADGCGCPTVAKAKDPEEHCPINAHYQASSQTAEGCDCKWCRACGGG